MSEGSPGGAAPPESPPGEPRFFLRIEALREEARRQPWHAVAALVLAIVGCTNALAKLADAREMQALAASTAASPAPNPFVARTRSKGASPADRAGSLRVEAQLASGKTVTVSLNQRARLGLDRPHRVEVGLLVATLLRGTMPRDALTSLLRFGLCDGGPLLGPLAIPDDVRQVAYVDRRKDTRRTVRVKVRHH